jgi:hypothetical protein
LLLTVPRRRLMEGLLVPPVAAEEAAPDRCNILDKKKSHTECCVL